MAGDQGPDCPNDNGHGEDRVADGRGGSSQGDGGLALPSDQVQARQAKPSRKPKVVREHPVATLVVTILVAVIAAVASIMAAVITRTPTAGTVGPLYPGDDSAFCGDVTYPDHTYVTVGNKFVKEWMLCNTGSVRWTGRFLVPSGEDIGNCEFPVRVRVPDTDPGQKVIVAVSVTPSAPGRCYVPWKMVNANDQLCFPEEQGIWFDVVARKAPS